MGRFARKYEVEQKRAIVALILDRGLSPAEAVGWAAEGRVEGCAAFVMSKDSARLYASQERHRRERRRRAELLANNPSAAIRDCASTLAWKLERETESIVREMDDDAAALDRIERAAKVLARLQQLVSMPDESRAPSASRGGELKALLALGAGEGTSGDERGERPSPTVVAATEDPVRERQEPLKHRARVAVARPTRARRCEPDCGRYL